MCLICQGMERSTLEKLIDAQNHFTTKEEQKISPTSFGQSKKLINVFFDKRKTLRQLLSNGKELDIKSQNAESLELWNHLLDTHYIQEEEKNIWDVISFEKKLSELMNDEENESIEEKPWPNQHPYAFAMLSSCATIALLYGFKIAKKL